MLAFESIFNLISSHLNRHDLASLRLVNKAFLQQIKIKYQQLSPYPDKFTFTMAMTGYFSVKDDYLDGLYIYRYTIDNYHSGKPLLFYKRGELDVFKLNDIYDEFADGEDPTNNSRIYCPGLTLSETHSWSTNATWLLACFHSRAPAITYTALSIWRRNNTDEVSAFAREITAAIQVGYQLKIKLTTPRIIQFLPRITSSNINIELVNAAPETVKNTLTVLIEQEKTHDAIYKLLSGVVANYLAGRGFRLDKNFDNLSEPQERAAAKNKTICVAYLIAQLIDNISLDQMAAALNCIQQYALETKQLLSGATNSLAVELLKSLKYIDNKILAWDKSAQFEQNTAIKLQQIKQQLSAVQQAYEKNAGLLAPGEHYNPYTLKASMWQEKAAVLPPANNMPDNQSLKFKL